jgi:hypothetical protein
MTYIKKYIAGLLKILCLLAESGKDWQSSMRLKQTDSIPE